jgi:hypothetical protein
MHLPHRRHTTSFVFPIGHRGCGFGVYTKSSSFKSSLMIARCIQGSYQVPSVEIHAHIQVQSASPLPYSPLEVSRPWALLSAQTTPHGNRLLVYIVYRISACLARSISIIHLNKSPVAHRKTTVPDDQGPRQNVPRILRVQAAGRAQRWRSG